MALCVLILLRIQRWRHTWAASPSNTAAAIERRSRWDLLESLAGNDMIAGRLRAAGFAEISIRGSGSKRQAEALWPNDDTTAEMPEQISAVTEIEVA